MGELFQKGRGAQINPDNPYHRLKYELEADLQDMPKEGCGSTEYIPSFPRTIINKVNSPDIPYGFSINPYQGCEHGCVYCYARNTHPYWGYSAGTDFEQKILVKRDVARLLENKLKSPRWEAAPIMLSGNTDCYQPVERRLELTRQLLKIFWKYRHPVGMITKNKLILRDLDLLKDLAGEQLVKVAITIGTLEEPLRQKLEPRTSSILSRLRTVEQLAANGIPVTVMAAPIIPGLNEHEIFDLAQEASKRGARNINYTIVRLNGDVGLIFEDWLERVFPDRKEKVMNKIRDMHGGKVSDSRFGTRMRGEGEYAEIIHKQFALARKQYFPDYRDIPYNCSLHADHKTPQLKLF